MKKDYPKCPECRENIYLDKVGKNRVLLKMIEYSNGVQSKAFKIKKEKNSKKEENEILREKLKSAEEKVKRTEEKYLILVNQNHEFKDMHGKLKKEVSMIKRLAKEGSF